MDAAREFQALPQSAAAAAAVEVGHQLPVNRGGGVRIEVLLARTQALVAKITENAENPNPIVLHALSTMIESLEARYARSGDHSSTNNSRSSHDLGCIGNLIRENNEFFQLITFKFLNDRRYSTSVKAATARLIFDCSLIWVSGIQNPHIFEDYVIDDFLGWVINEPQRNFGDDVVLEIETLRTVLDAETLHTYSIGLLAVCLTSGCLRMKDVLPYELPASLMRYLRNGVLDDVNTRAIDDAVSWKLSMPKTDEDIGEVFIVGFDSLALLKEKTCIQCLVIMAKHIKNINPLLREKGVDVCNALLKKCVTNKGVLLSRTMLVLPDILKLVNELATHRKFATLFVGQGGMQRLVDVPRNAQTFFSLSSLLFTIGSFKSTMGHVCALPANVVQNVVELAFALLECQDDLARKNAALFISDAFAYGAFVNAFDAKNGLQKLLHHLNDVTSEAFTIPIESFNNVGLNFSKRERAQQTCAGLHRYMKAHLLLFVDSTLRISHVREAHKRFDLSNEALEAIFCRIQKDRKLGPAFATASWTAIDKFLRSNGHITMLEICQAAQVMRGLNDLLQHGFGVLHIVTLFPFSRELIINSTLSNGRAGMAVIFDAIMTPAKVDPEVVGTVLHLLVNLVCPSQSIAKKSNAAIMRRQQASLNRTLNEQEKLEQGYHQAREAVRANSGIKALFQFLQPRIFKSYAALGRLHVLTCRVFLGLARDNEIANILLTLGIVEKLSELSRDCGRRSSGGEHSRWEAELAQLTVELIAVVTNSADTLAASDAVRTTYSCFERAAITASTPVSYDKREVLLLIHEHLQSLGLGDAAAALFQEAQLSAPTSMQVQTQWPSRLPHGGFFSNKPKHGRSKIKIKLRDSSQRCPSALENARQSPLSSSVLPMKRKSNDLKENVELSSSRLNSSASTSGSERITLDSLVIQYLKQRHSQCSSPITTVPPISLLHPHICPEPKQSLGSPSNMTERLSTREFRGLYDGFDVRCKERKYVYSTFRLRRTFTDDLKPLLTSIAFLGDSSQIATGGYSRKVKVFDYNTNSGSPVLESSISHTSRLTLLQSHFLGGTQLLLSSSSDHVCLWSGSSLSDGPLHLFEGIRGARFSRSGASFAAVPTGTFHRKLQLYDIATSQLNLSLTDANNNNTSISFSDAYSQIHFSPTNSTLVLWDGVLWDSRIVNPIHHFERYTDFGGGGFHPVGNEVITNSEVWDLRKLKLLRSVPSLNRTTIKFNSRGDVIYAIPRRNIEEVTSAFAARRLRSSFVSTFRTVDGLSYSDIATIPVERCVLDFATEPTDSFVGLVAMDNISTPRSSARVYEIGQSEWIEVRNGAAVSKDDEREVVSSLLEMVNQDRDGDGDGSDRWWSDGGGNEEDSDWEVTADEDVNEVVEDDDDDDIVIDDEGGDDDWSDDGIVYSPDQPPFFWT